MQGVAKVTVGCRLRNMQNLKHLQEWIITTCCIQLWVQRSRVYHLQSPLEVEGHHIEHIYYMKNNAKYCLKTKLSPCFQTLWIPCIYYIQLPVQSTCTIFVKISDNCTFMTNIVHIMIYYKKWTTKFTFCQVYLSILNMYFYKNVCCQNVWRSQNVWCCQNISYYTCNISAW